MNGGAFLFVALLALDVCGARGAPTLERVWVDQNSSSVRFDINVDKWWEGYFYDTVFIQAGIVAQKWTNSDTGCCWINSEWQLPVDITITVGNRGPDDYFRIGMQRSLSTVNRIDSLMVDCISRFPYHGDQPVSLPGLHFKCELLLRHWAMQLL